MEETFCIDHCFDYRKAGNLNSLVGVRFEKGCSLYYYMSGPFEPVKGDFVLAESDAGVEMGIVEATDCENVRDTLQQPIKAIIRVATDEDMKRLSENSEKEQYAYDVCEDRIRRRGLEMKLIKVKCLFDNRKILFYFFSEDRVDFRELVRDLASVFRTRIELRQVGVRDYARMLGGMGVCGRKVCCSTCITGSEPVSIRMAKLQGLALNPSGISGLCGRLMCCLAHENETYEYLHSIMPGVGTTVICTNEDGRTGKVIAENVLKKSVRVLMDNDNDEREVKEFSVEELQYEKRKHRREDRNGDRSDGED